MLDDSYFMKQALVEAAKAGERGEVPVEQLSYVKSGSLLVHTI